MPLVLVDDELSTGRTVLNTIAALHESLPRVRYVIATLVDMRNAKDRAAMATRAAELGVQIDVVSLAAGHLDLPSDVLERGQRLVEQVESRASVLRDAGPEQGPESKAAWASGRAHVSTAAPNAARGTITEVDVPWPPRTPLTCLLYTSPSPRDVEESRMPSSA